MSARSALADRSRVVTSGSRLLESESLLVARNLVARVMIRVDRGHERRNRGAPTPRPVPPERTPAPTFPWHTAANPGPPAHARAPRAYQPSPSTTNPLAHLPARLPPTV